MMSEGWLLMEPEDVQAEEVVAWEAQLEALHGRIAHRFSRSESHLRAPAYSLGGRNYVGSYACGSGWWTGRS